MTASATLVASSSATNHFGSNKPHIKLNSEQFGILSLFEFRPETARPLNELAEVLLRAESTLTRGERELIAAYVSGLNECRFCFSSHAAFAAAQLPEGMKLIEQVRANPDTAPISDKLKALLKIAAAVQQNGRKVGEHDVAAAREAGATDLEIHDTVLIAAAFCMFNRYVDGLATITTDDPGYYAEQAEMIISEGYVRTTPEVVSR